MSKNEVKDIRTKAFLPRDKMKIFDLTFLIPGLVMNATMTSKLPAMVRAVTTEHEISPK